MQVKDVDIKHARPDIFKIHPLGDIHGGTQACCEVTFAKKVQEIKNDPFSRWIGLGDYCECITPSDLKRWDGEMITDWLNPDNIAYDQANWFCEMVSPIADKCIGLLEGNHEESIRRYNHDNIMKMITDKLKVDYLGYSSFIRFNFCRSNNTRRQYVGYFTHGSGCAVTAGAKLIRLQRVMDNFEADIIAHAHVHDKIIYEKPYLTVNADGKVKQRTKVAAMTGCYFKTYTQGNSASYGERKSYPATVIGSPVFIINPDKDILRVENG